MGSNPIGVILAVCTQAHGSRNNSRKYASLKGLRSVFCRSA